MSRTETPATSTALPRIPYMWLPPKRNISWIRNQETAKHDRAEAARGEQRGPTDEIGGNESGEIPDPETLQGGAGGAGDCDRIGVGEQPASDHSPAEDPAHERQVPEFIALPVVAQVLGATGEGRAQMWRRLEETLNSRPRSRRRGITSPISGPVTYQGQG